MKSVEWRVCPICGNAYTTYPAISRKDNKTEICPKCGQQEALDAFLASKMENSNKDDRE